ncbi:hypothetical protein PGB90_005717 [Kerria lacca]
MPLENEGFVEQNSNTYKSEYKTKNAGCKIYDNFTLIVENFLNLLGSVLIVTYLLASPCCMLKEEIGRSYLISGLLTSAGISCLIVGIISSKLTITGAHRLGYLVCTLVFLKQENQYCPSYGDIYAMGQQRRTLEWQKRLQVIQGAVFAACTVQILIALVGNYSVSLPVAIAPTIILCSISVMKTSAVDMAVTCWSLFILYVGLLSVIGVWIICAVLSSFELVWIRSAARTDVYTGVLNYAATFRISYFFQWGLPKWKLDAISIILPAAFISIFEILANYYIISGKQSRGKVLPSEYNLLLKNNWTIFIIWEAFLCLISTMIGVALGVNVTYKKTKQKFHEIFVGIALILIASWGTFCALLVTIPEPIMAAFSFLVFLFMLFEGINLIQCINMKLNRNLHVLGVSLFFGLILPTFAKNGTLDKLTGFALLDDILVSVLSMEFVVGGLVAVIIDNLIEVFGETEYVQYTNENSTEIVEKDVENSIKFCDCLSPFFI